MERNVSGLTEDAGVGKADSEGKEVWISAQQLLVELPYVLDGEVADDIAQDGVNVTTPRTSH